MKTKREVLERFAEVGGCSHIRCTECEYTETCCVGKNQPLSIRLQKIGAMAILRQNRKKREVDINKILTCLTADNAKVGMKGYFADNLANMKFQFAIKRIKTLLEIKGEGNCARFVDDSRSHWYLFYPIGEEE